MGVQESIKHGINDSSIPLFNSFGFILCIFGQLKRGYEMANAAELMLENPGMNHKKSRGIVGFEIIRTWRAPIQLSLQPLLEGYQLGLEVGDIEAAGLNLYVRCTVLWFAGRPLKGVEKELETSVCVLAEINQEGPRLLVLACLLAARKLSGNSTPLRASLACNEGETMEDLLLVASEIGNNYLLGHVALVQIELTVFYHNWEAAKNLLIKFGDLRQCFRVFYQAVRYTFLKGLICLKTAQSAKSYLDRRKWKKRAQKAMKLMRTWLKKGNVNVVHSMHLLNAEYAVLKGNETDAIEMFKAAAAVAARNGSLQDKGLAHELAGEYFAAHGDEYWAKFNMDRAHQSYSDWQAHAKAEDLSERRNSLFGTGLGIEVN